MAKAAARTKAPKAFEWVTGEPLGRDSHTEVVRRAVLDGLAELRDTRGIATCERYTHQGADTWLRSTAVDALGRLGEALEDRRPEIREILLPILKDPEYRVRRATVAALGKMKDPDTIPALEGMEEGDIIGFVRVTARSSIRQIRKGQEARAQKADLDKAIGDLRDENRELKARLAKIEAQLGGLAKGKGGTKRGKGKRSTEGATGAAPPPGT
jgi:aminopeptidase N